MAHDTLERVIEQALEAESAAIVQTVATFVRGLAGDGDRVEMEEALRNRILSFGANLVARALEKADDQLREALRDRGHRDSAGNPCDGRIDGKGCKPVPVQMLLGSVVVGRWTGVCQKCGQWLGTVEELLEMENGMTAACASVVAMAGVNLPFLQAETQLKRSVGLEVDDNRVQRTVAAVAKRATSFVQGPPHSCLSPALPPKGARVSILMDGGRIRYREGRAWREPCAALVLWKNEDGTWTKYGASDPLHREPVLKILDAWMTALAARHDLEILVIGDGAEWIWEWAAKYPQVIGILDYYHLKENVWKAARVLHGEGTPQAAAWVDRIMDDLWAGRVIQVVDSLHRMKPRGFVASAKADAVQSLVTYLINHDDLIRYKRHRRAGRTIGSGAIESFCKQLFTMRMKGPGMFWSEGGAGAVMTLRTLYLTGHWNDLWKSRAMPLGKTG